MADILAPLRNFLQFVRHRHGVGMLGHAAKSFALIEHRRSHVGAIASVVGKSSGMSSM